MPRRHEIETVLSAIEDYDRGARTPIICQKYGITERTLYRWLRQRAPRGVAVDGDEPLTGAAFYRAAMRIVAVAIPEDERERVARTLGAHLRLTDGAAVRLLDSAA